MKEETVKIVIQRDLEKGTETVIDIPKENMNVELKELVKQQENSLAERMKKANQIRNKWEKR